ncbi:hypothetical protein [Hydrogenibacillus schlegelii]
MSFAPLVYKYEALAGGWPAIRTGPGRCSKRGAGGCRIVRTSGIWGA